MFGFAWQRLKGRKAHYNLPGSPWTQTALPLSTFHRAWDRPATVPGSLAGRLRRAGYSALAVTLMMAPSLSRPSLRALSRKGSRRNNARPMPITVTTDMTMNTSSKDEVRAPSGARPPVMDALGAPCWPRKKIRNVVSTAVVVEPNRRIITLTRLVARDMSVGATVL